MCRQRLGGRGWGAVILYNHSINPTCLPLRPLTDQSRRGSHWDTEQVGLMMESLKTSEGFISYSLCTRTRLTFRRHRDANVKRTALPPPQPVLSDNLQLSLGASAPLTVVRRVLTLLLFAFVLFSSAVRICPSVWCLSTSDSCEQDVQ